MLKHQLLDHTIFQRIPLPAEIETGLLSLFHVRDIRSLDRKNLQVIASHINDCLDRSKSEKGYKERTEAYAIYYLPVNYYKIWRPLYDLLSWDQIPISGSLLELGSGPGTSTLGLISFYILLAQENPEKSFDLRIHMIEQHHEFMEIFQILFDNLKSTFPTNLHITCTNSIADALTDLRKNARNYDIIYESNLFNHNEHIQNTDLHEYALHFKEALNKHGSLILIEPAERILSHYLCILKTELLQCHMTCFSPCHCGNLQCAQFSSARVDITAISLYEKLFEAGLIGKRKENHSFEYAVLRKDGLTKNNIQSNKVPLTDLSQHIGQRISICGFVLTCLNKETEDELSIKICDGTLSSAQQVWANIPKKYMIDDNIHCLVQGRGSYVKIKNARVLSNREIGIDFSTRIEISR